MKKVLVVHPFLSELGGAELAAMRVIEWLTVRYGASVTILALEAAEPAEMEQQAGIAFPPGSISVSRAWRPGWLMRTKGRFQLNLAYLQREAKKIAREYDLCVSTYNEADFGLPGFQYVHHPNFLPRPLMQRYHMIGTSNIFDRLPLLEPAHRAVVRAISGNTAEGFRKNRTAVSSQFMQEIFKRDYGIASTVLYPTFMPQIQSDPPEWADREPRCLYVGRFSPDKNLLELVDLFAALRPVWSEAEFMIVGKIVDDSYYRAVRSRADDRGIPLTTVTDASREAVDRLLRSSKVFVSPKRFEHFGLAVLEAANAGCLTFVHDSGGQREIIRPPELHYDSEGDLVRRVSLLLHDRDRRTDVLKALRHGMARLTLEDFFANLGSLLSPLLDV